MKTLTIWKDCEKYYVKLPKLKRRSLVEVYFCGDGMVEWFRHDADPCTTPLRLARIIVNDEEKLIVQNLGVNDIQ